MKIEMKLTSVASRSWPSKWDTVEVWDMTSPPREGEMVLLTSGLAMRVALVMNYRVAGEARASVYLVQTFERRDFSEEPETLRELNPHDVR